MKGHGNVIHGEGTPYHSIHIFPLGRKLNMVMLLISMAELRETFVLT